MPRIFRYSISMVMVLLESCVFGQVPDSVTRFDPTGIRVGVDMISIIKSQTGKDFTGWEINVDGDLSKRYYAVVDIGNWGNRMQIDRQRGYANGIYNNNGNYFRVGVDVNFLLKDPERNMFFIGFRYGRSYFSESLHYSDTLLFYGPLQRTVSSDHTTGGWAELTSGLRIKVWKGFWMGYTGRMKLAAHTHGSASLDSYDMPGYGLVQKQLWWGFNYQLFWRFGYRKSKEIRTSH